MTRRPSAPPRRTHRPADAQTPLAELGLTPLESEVYRFLLGAPGSTGYRIAQATGKPVGNIYKAIEALESKSAVLTSDDDGNRTARAIPVDEWIRLRKRAFDDACDAAAAALGDSGDGDPEHDEALYRLHSLDQTLERARTMIANATRLVVATVTPGLTGELAAALHVASKRKVGVFVKTFAKIDIPGTEVVVDPRGLDAVESAPGEWLVLNTDGRESLQALVAHDSGELLTACYSENPLLAWTHYSGLTSDLLLASVRQGLAAGASHIALTNTLERLSRFEIADSSGKTSMARRYRPAGRRGRAAR
ncbi:MAG: hypothetical protein JNM94_05850 [Phycisphaerae bacterium]|nr:hypothetical protein [Phycisphaerae bacterium]